MNRLVLWLAFLSPAVSPAGSPAEAFAEEDVQGRYSEAEPLYVRVLEILQSSPDPDHPTIAASLNNLAVLYASQGRYAEAEPLYLGALEIDEYSLGSDHPQIAYALSNLASLRGFQGRDSEAETLYLRALEIRESSLGPKHPDSAFSLNNLAEFNRSQGRYSEAESLHLRALEIQESYLGPDHPNTVTSLSNLAILYHDQGRITDACMFARRALDGCQAWILRELSRAPSERLFAIAGELERRIWSALSVWSESADARPLDQVYGPICAWKGVVFRHIARLSRAVASAAATDPELRRMRGELADLVSQFSTLAYAETIGDPKAHERKSGLTVALGAGPCACG